MPEILLVHIDEALTKDFERVPEAPTAVPVAATAPALARFAAAPDDVAAIVVAAGIGDPVQFVQRAHAIDPSVPMVLATDAGDADELRQALQMAPGVGPDYTCAAADDRATLRSAVHEAVRRRRGREPVTGPEAGDHERVGTSLAAGRFGRLLDHFPVGVIALDAHGGIRSWNRHARILLERPEREARGHPLALIFAAPERARLRAELERVAQGEAPAPLTLGRQQADGARQLLELTAAPHPVVAGAGTIVLLQDVTAREQAREARDRNEDALRANERRFRAVFEQAASGIALVSLEGRITHVNQRFSRLVGYSRDELVAMADPFGQLTHPDDLEVDRAYTEALAADEGEPFQLEKRYIHKDGAAVWVRQSVSPLRDEHGRIQQLIGVAENMDERKRAEAALQSSEERLRLILESLTNYAVFTTDLEGHVTDWNRGAARLLGYAESEIVGRSVDFIYPEEERCAGAHTRDLHQALRDGQSFDDRWYLRKDGTRFWASGLTNTLGRSGAPRGFVKVLRDRTESKRSRDQLEARARQQAAVAHFGQRALADLPLEQLIDEVVQVTAETLEVPLGALLHLTPDQRQLRLEAAEGWPRERVGVAHIEAGRGSHAGYTLMSGQPVVLEDLASETRFAASPLLREAGVMSGIAVAVAGSVDGPWGALQAYAREPRRFSEDDISFMQAMANTLAAAIKRYRTEQQLRELNETLEQRVAERTAETEQRAAQLRALTSELTQTEQRERRRLAQVLHDNLQQMLVAGKLQVGTALRTATDPACSDAVQRVGDLLDESIQESRSLTVELSPPVLYDAGLAAGLEWLGRWMQEHHGLTLEVDATEHAEPAGEDLRVLLFQGARELLFNVVKHADVAHAQVCLCRDEQQRIEMRVQDYGRGFDPAEAARAERSHGGFGLFSIRERLARLQGEVTVESAPGAGTAVMISVPEDADGIAESPANAATGEPHAIGEPGAEGAPTAFAGPIRVVLADDHDVVREGLVGVLDAQSDIAVIGEAGDGVAALERVRRERPDVVVLDVTMPRMNGVEATRIIASEFPQIPVIGLSVHESGDMAGAMRKAGAAAYLNKTEPSNRLLAAIREQARTRAR